MRSLVTLTGPPPWGFRLSGGRDFWRALTISKVTVSSKAELANLQVGDIIVEINGESATWMHHEQAQNRIKNSKPQLKLLIERPKAVTFGQPKCVAVSQQEPAYQKEMAVKTISEDSQEIFTDYGNAQSSNTAPKKRAPPPKASPVNKAEVHNPKSLSWEVSRPKIPLPNLEVFKGSRERDTAPRQSNTFKLIQEVLEQDSRRSTLRSEEKMASSEHPSSNLPFFRVRNFRTCESCGTLIVTQAIKINEERYRHQECYTCLDCGLSLLKRGHFWVGEEVFCGKHASQRYQNTQ